MYKPNPSDIWEELDLYVKQIISNIVTLYYYVVNKFPGLIDQDALVEALRNRKIGGAALDVTTPEPLPPDHPLLHLENACEY